MEIVFTWSKEGLYEYNDYAMVVVYDSEKKRVQYQPAIATRGKGTATFKINDSYLGNQVLVYLAFTSDDRKQRSNSMYLGKLTVI